MKQNCLRHNWDINFLTDSEHGLVEVAQSRVYKEMKIEWNANCGEWYKHFTLNMTDWPVNLILLCSNVNICKICSAGFVTIHPSEWTSFTSFSIAEHPVTGTQAEHSDFICSYIRIFTPQPTPPSYAPQNHPIKPTPTPPQNPVLVWVSSNFLIKLNWSLSTFCWHQTTHISYHNHAVRFLTLVVNLDLLSEKYIVADNLECLCIAYKCCMRCDLKNILHLTIPDCIMFISDCIMFILDCIMPGQ